jgi:protein-tyrosine phosphatase
VNVLFVCTANQCRSPVAQRLLELHLAALGPTSVSVRSAGLLTGGTPIPAAGLQRLRNRGINASDHRSVQIDRATAQWADVILGLSRNHVRELVASDDSLYGRTFTLKDFVRRAELGRREAGEPVRVWTARLGAPRQSRQLLGHAGADDVEDPMRRSDKVWNAVFAEIDDWTQRLAVVLTDPSVAPT